MLDNLGSYGHFNVAGIALIGRPKIFYKLFTIYGSAKLVESRLHSLKQCARQDLVSDIKKTIIGAS